MAEIDANLREELKTLGAVLKLRANLHEDLLGYYDGNCPIPTAVQNAKLANAYRFLMPMSEAAWGSVVVDSVLDRLEVQGFTDPVSDQAGEKAGEFWQANMMDAESKLAHSSALIDGRCFALVWEDEDTDEVAVQLDDCTQMAVMFREGSRRVRRAAMRYWKDSGGSFATLYHEDAIYKFKAGGDADLTEANWEKRQVEDEDWPLENPLNRVPVVELGVNRRLAPGRFPFARGEYAHCRGLIDRINTLTFLGLVVAFWLGFPLRGVIGDKILRDDDGNIIPPFKESADTVFQLENPEAKIAEYKAADRKNLSVFAELDQLAVITKTPRHYFPLEQGMVNISADAIRASEGGLHAKTAGHKATLGEGWEEVVRLGGELSGDFKLSQRAKTDWKDHENRSLAERADAASKLKDVLPWQATAEMALNVAQEDIARWSQLRASDPLASLVAGIQEPVVTAEPVPEPAVGNGNRAS